VVVIALAGWLFWGFGWLDDLGPIAPVSLGLVSTLAVMGVIVTRYREEGDQ
jgi:UDP-N-acetylmuramyl pentapeptide phosphotransferase/UDP-N-acetylglucosamine-1-phosphate transferase